MLENAYLECDLFSKAIKNLKLNGNDAVLENNNILSLGYFDSKDLLLAEYENDNSTLEYTVSFEYVVLESDMDSNFIISNKAEAVAFSPSKSFDYFSDSDYPFDGANLTEIKTVNDHDTDFLVMGATKVLSEVNGVTVSNQNQTVKAGDKLQYTITYNVKSTDTRFVVITDTLPAGVSYENSSNSGSHANGVVSWILPVSAVGQGSVTVEVTVDADASGILTNEAVIEYRKADDNNPNTPAPGDGGKTEEDEEPKNETPVGATKVLSEVNDTAVTNPNQAVKAGDKLQYTITYNVKSTDTRFVVITDTLPNGVSYESSSNSGAHNNGIVTWTIPVSAVGQGSVTVEVIVEADASEVLTNEAVIEYRKESETTPGQPAPGDGGKTEEDEEPKNETPVGATKVLSEVNGVTVSNQNQTVKAGDKLQYTITYNVKSTDTRFVVITDTLPDGVSYESSSNSGSHANGVVSWILPVSAVGQGSVTVEVIVEADAKGILTNEAVIEYRKADDNNPNTPAPGDGGKTEEDEEPKNETPVGATKVLSEVNGVTVSNQNQTVKAGDKLQYTITYNVKSTDTRFVVITDTLPDGVSYESSSNSGSHANGVVSWILPVSAVGQGSVTVEVIVEADAKGILTNEAVIEYRKADDNNPNTPAPGDGGKTEEDEEPKNETPVGATKVLSEVNDTAVTNPNQAVKAGDKLQYTITYNVKSTDTRFVVITDTLPEGVSYESSSNSGAHNNGIVTWTIPVSAVGQGSVTVEVTVNADASGVLTNEAVIEYRKESETTPGQPAPGDGGKTEEDEEPKNETPMGATKVLSEVNGVTVSNQNQTVKAGDKLQYTITYNVKSTDTRFVVITDTLPDGVSYENSSNSGSHANGVVSWILPVSAVGQGSVTVEVIVDADAKGILTNEAVIEYRKADDNNPNTPAPGDGGKTEEDEEPKNETPVGATKVLSEVNDTAVTNPNQAVKAGDKLQYTITYNVKSTDTRFVVITDTLPEGVSYESSSNSGAHNNGIVTWTIPVSAVGQGSVTVEVTVDADAKGILTNEAVIEYRKESETTPGQPAPGDGGKTEEDEEPKNETPVGATKVLSEVNGVTVSNQNQTVKAGDKLQYTITYNVKSTDTRFVVITDTLPAGVSYENSSNSGSHANGVVSWILPVSAVGQGSVTVEVIVDADAKGILTNEAVIEYRKADDNNPNTPAPEDGGKTEEDEEPKNETPVGATKVLSEVNGVTVSNQNQAVKAGDKLQYTITYNVKSTDTRFVVITDTLPAGVSYENSSNSGSHANGVVSWILPVSAVGQGSVTVEVIVEADAKGILTNEAVIEYRKESETTPGQPAPGDGGKTEEDEEPKNETPVGATKVLSEVNDTAVTNPNQAVKAGDKLQYTITYNVKSTDTRFVVITDTLPEGVSYESSSNSGSHANGVVSWILPVSAVGQGSVTVEVIVEADASGVLTNEAVIEYRKADDNNPNTPAPGDGGKTEEDEKPKNEIPVGATKVLSEVNGVTVTNPNQAVKAGDKLQYTITYNVKSTDTRFVVITDTLPAGVSYENSSNSGAHNNGIVTWTIPVSAVGQGSVTVEVTVDADASGILTNEAVIEYRKADDNNPNTPAPGDGGKTEEDEEPKNETPVGATKVLSEVNDTAVTNPNQAVKAGDKLQYTITYNVKSTDTRFVVITDTLPNGVSYESSSNSGAHNNGIVTWTIPVSAVGQGSVTVEVIVEADASEVLTNEAVIEYRKESETTPGQPAPGDGGKTEEDEEPKNETPVGATKVLSEVNGVTVSNQNQTVKAGDKLQYTITYNVKSTDTRFVVITDTLPDGVSYESSSNSGSHANGVVSWILPVSAVGQGSVTVEVIVEADAKGILTNEAVIEYRKADDNNPNTPAPGDGGKTEEDEEPKNENPVDSKKTPYIIKSIKIGSPGYNGSRVMTGQEIVYQLEYRNTFTEPVDVIIRDRITLGLRLTGYTENPKQGSSVTVLGETITWYIPDVAPNESGKLEITAVVTASPGEQVHNQSYIKYQREGTDVSNERPSNRVTNDVSSVPSPPNSSLERPGEQDLTYRVRFHWNDGRDSANDIYYSRTVVRGNKVSPPTPPEREGYIFSGWYMEPECISLYDFNTPVNKDLDLYAKWKKISTSSVSDNSDINKQIIIRDILDKENHYAYIVGYPDGTVRPENNITRAEAASIFFRLLTDGARNTYYTSYNSYWDVEMSDWFNKAVSTVTNAQLFHGYPDQNFTPNSYITRAEFATILAGFFTENVAIETDKFNDIDGHWAKDYINLAASYGWISGYSDGSYRPDMFITRAEVASIINRVLERLPEDKDALLPDMIHWPDNNEMDWYYLDIQEATNSHDYIRKEDSIFEIWIDLTERRNWHLLERP